MDFYYDGFCTDATGPGVEGWFLQRTGERRVFDVEQEHMGALLHDAGQCADTSGAGKAADTRAELCNVDTGCRQAVRLYVQPLWPAFPTKKCSRNAEINGYD